MIKCKACGNDMDMVEVPGGNGQLEILCDHCIKASADALRVSEWDYEGQWWDKNWGDGKQAWENLNERIKTAELEGNTPA